MTVTQEGIQKLFQKAMDRLLFIEGKNAAILESRTTSDQLTYTKRIFNAILNPPNGFFPILRTVYTLPKDDASNGRIAFDLIPNHMSYDLVCLLNELCSILSSEKEAYHVFISNMHGAKEIKEQFDGFISQQKQFNLLLTKYETDHPELRRSIVLSLESNTDKSPSVSTGESVNTREYKEYLVLGTKDDQELQAQRDQSAHLLPSTPSTQRTKTMTSEKTLDQRITELTDAISRQKAELNEQNQRKKQLNQQVMDALSSLQQNKEFNGEPILLANATLGSVDNCSPSRARTTFRDLSAESMDPADKPREVEGGMECQQALDTLKNKLPLFQKKKHEVEEHLKGLDHSSLNKLLSVLKLKLKESQQRQRPCKDFIDFSLIKKHVADQAGYYEQLLEQQITVKNSDFKTLGKVFEHQNRGKSGTALCAEVHKEVLSTLIDILEKKANEFKKPYTQSSDDLTHIIKTIEPTLTWSDQIRETLESTELSQKNLDENQKQLDVLTKTSQNHSLIKALNETIESTDLNELDAYINNNFEQIQNIAKKPSKDSEYDSNYEKERIPLLEATKETLVQKLDYLIKSRADEVTALKQNIGKCKNSADCNIIEEKVSKIGKDITKTVDRVKRILELFPDSSSIKAHQNNHEQVEGAITCQQPLIKAIAEFEKMATTKRNEIRNNLLSPLITEINSHSELQANAGSNELPHKNVIARMLHDYMENASDSLLSNIKTQLQTNKNNSLSSKTRQMLTRIELVLLDDQNPTVDANIRTEKWQQLGAKQDHYSLALKKLYEQIQVFKDHAIKLSSENNTKSKQMSEAPLQLANELESDLDRFIIAQENLTPADWKGLNEVFMNRLSANESRMSEHRSLWKQIAAFFLTFPVFGIYQATRSYYKTGNFGLFQTERQIKLGELKTAATIAFQEENGLR